jgi:hypothetical protein
MRRGVELQAPEPQLIGLQLFDHLVGAQQE